MDWKSVFFVFCTVLIGKTVGLRCYACSFSASDSDQLCLIITESTNIVECPHPYCTILRQEYLDPSGTVASFSRGCESHPDFLNHEITDDSFKTYYRACTSDLCNTGNGIEAISGGNLNPYPQYDGANLLVPGTGRDPNGASSLTISLTLLIFSIFTVYLLSINN